jgi:hypothetical protein
MNIVWPNISLPGEVLSAWFEAYCEHPLIFHCMNWTLAVHHDLLCSKLDWTTSRCGLTHKAKAFSALRELVPNVSRENASIVLFGVLLLAALDTRRDSMDQRPVFLFEPHLPAANWLNVYGRMDKPVEPHANAVHVLIGLVGGVENATIPGLDWMMKA